MEWQTLKSAKFTKDTKELYEAIKEGTAKARNGEPTNPLMLELKSLLESGLLDTSLHNAMGWFLYFRIKNSQPNDFVTQKNDLSTYLKLETTKPSPLHSLMLHEAVRMKKLKPDRFKFINFLTLWNPVNLREEDWEPYEVNENARMPSLVEKILGCYAKELPRLKIEASPEISSLADKAIEKFPGNSNLPLYKAAIAISRKDREEALGYIKSLLIKQPTKSHLWRKAYELVGPLDLKVVCLCKAISLQKDEAFLGNARLKLARLFQRKGLSQFALFELQEYHRLYTSKRWSLSKEYDYIRNQISPEVRAEDSRQIYARFMPLAEEFLYASLPTTAVTKVSQREFADKYHPGKTNLIWTLKTADGQILYLHNPHTKGLNPAAPDGTGFHACIMEGKIVWITST